MLFRGLERAGRSLAHLLVAGIEVDEGTVGQFPDSTLAHLLQMRLGALIFMLLHGLESSLVILHSLCKTRIEAQVVIGGFPLGSGGWFRHAPSKCLCNLELSRCLFKFCLGF